MASIAEVVGYVVGAVALLNTLLQIISYLSNEELRVQLGTWIKDKVNNLTEPTPAPVANHVTNNNQTYNNRYTFTQPCYFTLTAGNGPAPEFNQIQGSHPAQIANQAAAPDVDPSDWLSEDASEKIWTLEKAASL